ncbi:wings apart-like protein regulation of heterochromatin-domain-containing protein [Tirmania nivea]|nr:wings apart-like protein regulation of heterochromatin-domain-containing protein [Tirmania nivea]
MERGPTPPRRRRLIDTLEVDWTVRRPKQHILEAEMDVDSDFGSVDDTPMITLTDSQPFTDSQNTDEVEDAAQAFQRGVGAIHSAQAFPQRNTRVTYARQRSFLTEEVKEGGDPFADPLLLPVRDFGRGLRKGPVVEEVIDEGNGPGMMKSLHELREAGVNKRFLDSVEGYFEDIEKGFSIGQKRVGYIELATRLRDKTFFQKFRANNFERRLLKDFGKQDDEIVHFILCFIVWSFLDEDTSSQFLQLVHKKGIISMLDSMLDSTRDMKIIVKDKKANMTKAAQSLLLEFCDIIKSSKIFGGKAPKSLTPQILALAVLDSVMKSLRRAGFMGEYLSVPILKKLVRVLEPFQMTADLEKKRQGDPLFIELPVSILESYSIGRDSVQDVRFSEEDLDILANIVPGVMQLKANDFQPIQLLILRLHINLTNHRPDICDRFGKHSVIKALVSTAYSTFEALAGPLEEEARLIQLDMLVLSLALMINFAEMSDSAGSSFVEDSYATSQLAVLLKLFLGRMERAAEADSMEETQSNVAFGYLSILLGNLCRNTTVRGVVRSQMPKKNLEPLVTAVQEFVSHNQKVDEERAITGGEGEVWHTGFTERLEQVAIRLKAAEGYS